MAKAPAFQLYTKDFDTDERVMLMNLEQEGAFFRLLRVHWREGSIPAEPESLALLCRTTGERFERHIWPRVAPCFSSVDELPGRLVNPRMHRDRQRLEAFKEERSASGRKGNAQRWGQRSLSDDVATAERVAPDRPPDCSLRTADSNLQSAQTATDSSDRVLAVFDHWREAMGHAAAKLTPKRQRLIQARLRDSSLDEVLRAIDGCRASAWHMGANPESTRYDDLTLILRDRDKVEMFMAKAGTATPARRRIDDDEAGAS